MRVLLVEDDAQLGEVVLLGLRQEHLAVDHATTVAEAIELLLVTKYDIVCLDLGLPDGDGLQLCRQLRTPADEQDVLVTRPDRVLILTARDDVADRVAGLDAGADDYLIKPIKMAELAARIRALSRRSDQPAGPLVIGDLSVDVVAHAASRGGRALDLTGREFAVLRYFALRMGEVISSEELLEHCWDANTDAFSGSVRVILSRLRKKLGDPAVIHTIKGVGYRLGEPQ
ncbi:MAG: response regulator transcription factor [Acidimicrobiia bacterium]|nr:response regulator transcription factor [Acidimicrobiia bacterium]